jgi:molybdopterin-guanine dinucleotide biosynthesis protein A
MRIWYNLPHRGCFLTIFNEEMGSLLDKSACRNKDITGVILVGGKSRRMGRDKAFLELAGKTLFERLLDLFRKNFERILLVGNDGDRFSRYGFPIVPDIYAGSSLGGIYTGLYHSETEHIFVSSCDLPFPNGDVLRYLCQSREGFDAVVTTTPDGYEPLFALYSKSCLGPIKNLIESGDFCAYGYFKWIRVRYVPYEELAHLDRNGNAFVNVNTPEEFKRIGGKI